MKQLRTHPAAKAVAAVLALVALAGGFWASLFTLSQWDNLWWGSGYYDSNNYYSNLYNRYRQVQELARLNQMEKWEGRLTYLDQQRQADLMEALTPAYTNFRFRIVENETGNPVYGNLNSGLTPLDDAVHHVERDAFPLSYHSQEYQDSVSWEEGEDGAGYPVLHVAAGREELVFTPDQAADAARFGWCLEDGDWRYDEGSDDRVLSAELAIEYGVADPLTIHDEFWEGRQDYDSYNQYLPLIALLALALDAAAAGLVVFLCLGAGRRRGAEGAVCGGFDRLPFDLLCVLEFFALALLLNGGDTITYAANLALSPDVVVGLAVVSLAVAGCLLALLLSLIARIRTRTLFSNTVIWRLCKLAALGFFRMGRDWPLTGRVVGLFLLYLLGTLLTTMTLFLIPVYQGLVLWALCRWTIQWKRIRGGTAEIVGGNPEYKIDTTKMYRDLKEHAGALNDLGSAIGNAVDEQLKSERFKAELITNVSHDLKTPLTSIINYVDLLKKEEIESPKALEYLEVLERKSQRLKKLTEDLVEASKASTGNLTVVRERLGMVQLVRQALGEFEEKFQQHALSMVADLPEEEVYIQADGRHLWRVIDNLLSNCNKYALEGTRVYLDVRRWDRNVTLSVKNISKQQLNIPADQLMERFVRGEESRTTEGSGLGLSIARSLTELQGGVFRLDIDGDLFKATVSFPEAPRAPAALPA